MNNPVMELALERLNLVRDLLLLTNVKLKHEGVVN